MSPQNLDYCVYTQSMDTNPNHTQVTDLSSTLLDDGTMFFSHTINTISFSGTKNRYENHSQPVNLTELPRISEKYINKTLPILPYQYTMNRIQSQNSVATREVKYSNF